MIDFDSIFTLETSIVFLKITTISFIAFMVMFSVPCFFRAFRENQRNKKFTN